MQVWLTGLPDKALAAAAQFHGSGLTVVAAALAARPETLTLIFSPADYTHRAWRLAAVQALARQHAPIRINAVVSDDDAAITAADAYLASAEGVTGQLLMLDSQGAGDVIG